MVGSGNGVQIVQRHHFASHLKRMAVVVRVQEQFLAFVKEDRELQQTKEESRGRSGLGSTVNRGLGRARGGSGGRACVVWELRV
ncbi:hypothetical protein U1Q18_043449 [Sarracenia purpurea var. burkii]